MSRQINTKLLERLVTDLIDSMKELEDLRVDLGDYIKDDNFVNHIGTEKFLTYISEASKRSGLITAIANECKLLEEDIKYNINIIPQEAIYASQNKKQSTNEILDPTNFASLFTKPPNGSPSGSKN